MIRQILASVTIGIVITIVIILLRSGVVNLGEYITALSVGLSLACLGIGYWGFKPQINRFIRTTRGMSRIKETATKTEALSEPTITTDERKNQTGEVKLLGHPNSISQGIRHYNSRAELPSFGDILSLAQSCVDMISVTFHIVTLQNIKDIRNAIYRGVRFMFLILDPNSSYIQSLVQAKTFHGGEDIRYQIQRSLDILCKEKERLPPEKRGNLIIKTYDSIIEHSIIVVDQDNPDNAWIKIEDYPQGSDSNSRPNHAAFKKDNQSFFNHHFHEYATIISTTEYNCKSEQQS